MVYFSKMKITRLILLLAAILVPTISTNAEDTYSQRINREGFYVGTHAAISTAESNFSSFGVNKFYPGWNAGINAGYQFTSIWALELTASGSQASLIAQDCCLSRDYFLGSDLNRYHQLSIIPEGVSTQYYENLMSKVFVQRYGLQVNFNVLGLFKRTKRGPWGLGLSPAIYAAGTHASILTQTDKAPIAKNITTWHLAYGGQLFASYAVAKNMHVGLYGAYTQYVGRSIDALPHVHSTNYTVDAGVKFIVTFNKKKNTIISEEEVIPLISDQSFAIPEDNQELSSSESPLEEVLAEETPTEEIVSEVSDTTPNQPVTTDDTAIAEQQETTTAISSQEEEAVAKMQKSPINTSKEEELTLETPFPFIYFSFNSVWIEPEQRAKVEEIAQALKADSSVRIRVVGWGDELGGEKVNKRVSLQRAESVKERLVRCSISANRIEAVGGGIAPNTASLEDGRIAIVQIIP